MHKINIKANDVGTFVIIRRCVKEVWQDSEDPALTPVGGQKQTSKRADEQANEQISTRQTSKQASIKASERANEQRQPSKR
jgi:hypothetical protein